MCMFKETQNAYRCDECPEAFACDDRQKETETAPLLQEEELSS